MDFITFYMSSCHCISLLCYSYGTADTLQGFHETDYNATSSIFKSTPQLNKLLKSILYGYGHDF